MLAPLHVVRDDPQLVAVGMNDGERGRRARVPWSQRARIIEHCSTTGRQDRDQQQCAELFQRLDLLRTAGGPWLGGVRLQELPLEEVGGRVVYGQNVRVP